MKGRKKYQVTSGSLLWQSGSWKEAQVEEVKRYYFFPSQGTSEEGRWCGMQFPTSFLRKDAAFRRQNWALEKLERPLQGSVG